jgi:hypothetical protein
MLFVLVFTSTTQLQELEPLPGTGKTPVPVFQNGNNI